MDISAITDAVNRDDVLSFLEEDAMIADAQTQQSFELAPQGFNGTYTNSGVDVDCREDVERGFLFDRSDLPLHIRAEADRLQVGSIDFPHLIQREAASRYHFLKRQAAIRVLAKVFP